MRKDVILVLVALIVIAAGVYMEFAFGIGR